MKRKFRIHPERRTMYLDAEIVADGFKGDVDGYANAYTLTIARPDVSLEQVRDSLRTVLKDIEMRLKYEKDEVATIQPDNVQRG